jgi:hypothetical protein
VPLDQANGAEGAAEVARALATPPVTIALVLARRELLPARPGFYAWWIQRGAMQGVPLAPHPQDDALGLLYVGVSPRRHQSKQTIRSRVIANHIRGNIGSSTFRYVLAALLRDELGLRPEARQTKLVLSHDDNARLRRWQDDNLHLTWCVREQPWQIEDAVIALMRPPLNSAGNQTHPFFATVRCARAALRASASQ